MEKHVSNNAPHSNIEIMVNIKKKSVFVTVMSLTSNLLWYAGVAQADILICIIIWFILIFSLFFHIIVPLPLYILFI